MTDWNSSEIEFTIGSGGSADGMRFSARGRMPVQPDGGAPLIVAIHGGTYTSEYFDVPGYSLLDRAAQNGVPIVAIDRPGYGKSTAVAPSESIFLANAEVLEQAIAELWAQWDQPSPGIVLIGHSMGGVIATAIAALRPSWPLLGIAISGCLLEAPPGIPEVFAAMPDEPIVLERQMKDFAMFGPDWTHGPDMPSASYMADAAAPKSEFIDVTSTWLGNARWIAAHVQVPVHYRQGEFDHLWVTDAEQVAEYAAAFASAPSVDAQLVPSTGHCIDFHRMGHGFQLDQIGFALRCCVESSSDHPESSSEEK